MPECKIERNGAPKCFIKRHTRRHNSFVQAAEYKSGCSCTYEPCSRKGICCECVTYHRKNRELPGCFFSKDIERTYDRSFDNFLKNQDL